MTLLLSNQIDDIFLANNNVKIPKKLT